MASGHETLRMLHPKRKWLIEGLNRRMELLICGLFNGTLCKYGWMVNGGLESDGDRTEGIEH
jgi:hypothetical protein